MTLQEVRIRALELAEKIVGATSGARDYTEAQRLQMIFSLAAKLAEWAYPA